MSYHTKNQRQKLLAQEIVEFVLEEMSKDPNKIGVLLCEGEDTSIDKVVYSALFPELVIVPVGACVNVMRLLHRVRKLLAIYKIYAFGIIDRDALSKPEMKRLLETSGVYTTKLPFIENIICAPEVIQYVCVDLKLDYDKVLEKISKQLISLLWRRFIESLPINLGIGKNERIKNLKIEVATKKKKIEKAVTGHSILYVYRSKVIVSVVASETRMRNRGAYYTKIKQMLEDERYRTTLIKIMSKYVRKFALYEFDEYQKESH